MSNELIISDPQRFLPVLSVAEAVQRRCAIVEFVQQVMKPNIDFGVIPGTQKPTLLKPGAEKLCTLFGLTTRFQLQQCIEDWLGERHEGEPFFYYHYRCQLWRDDHLIAEGDGSCNSFEQKYRYRDAQRVCPECSKAAIVKGKVEYGGGWLCFVKRGGCGAKFADGDAIIEDQPVGRVPNPDVADQVNTIQKMGQKRALIASTLLAVNASEFFTQDIEDIHPLATALVPSQRDSTPAEPALSASTESDKPQSAAATARHAFEALARARAGISDPRLLGELAVALLKGRPQRWTADVWHAAASRPETEWREAVEQLKAGIGR